MFALSITAPSTRVEGASPAESGDGTAAFRDCLSHPVNTDERQALETAIAACSAALRIGGLDEAKLAEVLAHRGIAFRNADELPKSLGDLLLARAYSPNDPSIARMLAWTLRQMRDFDKAEAEYTAALALEQHWQAYLSRCVVRLDLGKYQPALDDCEIAAKLTSNEDTAYFTAVAYIGVRRHVDAMHLLEQAISGSIASGRIYSLLAEAYEAVGRPTDAEAMRVEGRKKFPENADLERPPEPAK